MNMRSMTVLMLLFAMCNYCWADNPPRNVDLAICIDTSNSMDGLIDSAKIKLWRVVNDLAKIDPAPSLRVALYSYGNDNYDMTKGWVKKEIDLTHDIDEVYRKLFELHTKGGTELVARVSRDALVDLKWSMEKGSLRLIFVCGNEPADQDKEVSLSSVVNLAKKKDVFVNTIYCQYGRPDEESGWRVFAELTGGKHAVINQNKKRPLIDTPYDRDIQGYSSHINRTYIPLGAAGRTGSGNQAMQDRNALSVAPSASLERGSFKASKLYRNDWDLCDKVMADPKFSISSLKPEDLPEEMRKMSDEEKIAHVRKMIDERKNIQKKVSDLTSKRAKFIEEAESKLPPDATDKGFDEAIRSIIRQQAATKGMKIP